MAFGSGSKQFGGNPSSEVKSTGIKAAMEKEEILLWQLVDLLEERHLFFNLVHQSNTLFLDEGVMTNRCS